MNEKKIPFVGLHAHSVAGSIFDAIGYPDEHMDFCYENGGEALALTDHGNMNGFSHQFLHWQKMKDEGKEFKPIFGVEAYFLPSIDFNFLSKHPITPNIVRISDVEVNSIPIISTGIFNQVSLVCQLR